MSCVVVYLGPHLTVHIVLIPAVQMMVESAILCVYTVVEPEGRAGGDITTYRTEVRIRMRIDRCILFIWTVVCRNIAFDFLWRWCRVAPGDRIDRLDEMSQKCGGVPHMCEMLKGS